VPGNNLMVAVRKYEEPTAGIPEFLPSGPLCTLMGLCRVTLTHLTTSGVVPRPNAKGHYPVALTIQGYIRYLSSRRNSGRR
jgi:hypothetical protein